MTFYQPNWVTAGDNSTLNTWLSMIRDSDYVCYWKPLNLDIINPHDDYIENNRLNDPKFNKNNLKGQTLYTQVSKFGEYNKKISIEFEEKILKIKEEGVYLSIEETQRGSQSLRLRTSKEKGNLDKSFPPNENSVKIITKLIKGE